MKGEGMFDERDVLLKAAERISEEGMWCQGWWFQIPPSLHTDIEKAWEKETGLGARYSNDLFLTFFAERVQTRGFRVPECLEGAVASAAVALDPDRAADLYRNALNLLDFGVEDCAFTFNDTHGQTADGVAAKLREAAL